MRSILITILLIIITIDTCEGIRGLKMSKFINNLNKAINNACNKQAYILTNNTEIYNCLRYNISNKCNHLDNFTEYNNIRSVCLDKNNNEVSRGIIITIVIWLILALSFH